MIRALVFAGSLRSHGRRGSYDTGWPFGRGDPDDDVRNNVRTGDQGRESPKDSNESWIHVEIIGYTSAHAGNFPVIRGAYELLRRGVDRLRC